MFEKDCLEFFMELRSFDSLALYPRNNASHFKVQFDRELIFNGKWEVSLRDIVIDSTVNDESIQGKNIYILCNIIEEGFVGSSLRPLLRRITAGTPICTVSRAVFHNSGWECFKNVTVTHCMSIEIRMENEHGKLISFTPDTKVTTTLHFLRNTQRVKSNKNTHEEMKVKLY
jgi:hypothetical protein